jgi:16S rRNA (cytosine967-C5)-methyltransferase
MPATPARQLALAVTRQIRERNAYAHPLIEAQVRTAEISQAERDFAILLILGVVASSGELDYLIDRALPHGTVKPKVRDALRIAIYELFFLQKEAYIAVSQGVELVRGVAPHASGFANRVLREAARLKPSFPFGDPAASTEALAHQHAFPLWLTERFVADLGFDQAAGFMAASNLQAPVFLIDVATGTTVQVAPPELPAWLPRVEAGECIIADASVPEVVARALPRADQAPQGQAPGQTPPTQASSPTQTPPAQSPFLEVGSGRGTKTVLLQRGAQRLNGRQLPLFALDIHGFKHDILKERISAYGLETVTPVTGDATRLDELIAAGQLPSTFGAALIDAPCSGTGTLRRHPEIRWRLTPDEVTAMATRGLAMLSEVARHIEPGGFVTYSTCSVLKEENEQVIEAFLASEAGAAFGEDPQPFRSALATGHSEALSISDASGAPVAPASSDASTSPGLSSLPDAHFAVRLSRRA